MIMHINGWIFDYDQMIAVNEENPSTNPLSYSERLSNGGAFYFKIEGDKVFISSDGLRYYSGFFPFSDSSNESIVDGYRSFVFVNSQLKGRV